jgi:hypothetical protein
VALDPHGRIQTRQQRGRDKTGGGGRARGRSNHHCVADEWALLKSSTGQTGGGATAGTLSPCPHSEPPRSTQQQIRVVLHHNKVQVFCLPLIILVKIITYNKLRSYPGGFLAQVSPMSLASASKCDPRYRSILFSSSKFSCRSP